MPPQVDARMTVAGVAVSHPDRIVYPQPATTKLALARYYESVGEWMVPHVKGRPLTLVHCPAGLGGRCAYMRHTRAWGPSALRRVRIQEKTKVGEYLVADDVSGIVALAQMGMLEIHTWNATDSDIERPNRLIWDLDPGRAVSWPQVVAAARAVKAVLETLGLASWVKTTGGRGLHVVVPIARHRDWSECLAFARGVARVLERHDGAAFTTAFAKRGRERQILVDYLRNNRTNTSVAAFSTRARDGAPVSTPIAWDELGDEPEPFTIVTVPRRLARLRRDPWAGYWTSRQRVSRASFSAVTSER
jgi:bifunctional non-homologous end joining protein LigD